MLRILIVCTGNTCRSPMTEALLQRKVKENNLTEIIRVLSAGIAAGADSPASDGAVHAMGLRNIDLSAHRSRQLLFEYIEASDLILTMTERHKRAVLQLAPQAGAKVFTLAEYAGETVDIADPFGGSHARYEACARQIEDLVNKIWEKIVDLAGKKS
ncbi:protein-tyrosine phosphatase low molecular weight [Lucifera butyrica]|uniref:Protein-tyrosine phosphatase low molecular weight n=1 Tax=Lucifera butyrica TaxID=1351585 RepID=A0A498R6K9_9FIRM|nr:low molecular weight protein arginine phosphatase [Lucifera butyrica]VBB06540.1 protein-tyrosine phosphatase low molecular weight [Lucifera butyrica]